VEEEAMEDQDTTLDVRGMTCGGCVRHVTHALEGIDGVRRVEVRLAEGRALVRHDGGRAPVRSLLEAVGEAGYDASVAG
jgi:copper chaperone CopZ